MQHGKVPEVCDFRETPTIVMSYECYKCVGGGVQYKVQYKYTRYKNF